MVKILPKLSTDQDNDNDRWFVMGLDSLGLWHMSIFEYMLPS